MAVSMAKNEYKGGKKQEIGIYLTKPRVRSVVLPTGLAGPNTLGVCDPGYITAPTHPLFLSTHTHTHTHIQDKEIDTK